MADADDFIFTKLIVVSPKYVLVNQMKTPIEVAQVNMEETTQGRQVMEVGDRKEWVWSDSTKENLICVRKMGLVDYEASRWSSSDEESDFSESEDGELDKAGNGAFLDDEDSKPIIRMHKRADDSYEYGDENEGDDEHQDSKVIKMSESANLTMTEGIMNQSSNPDILE